MFSKTFGYTVRGILYIISMQDLKHYVQVEEIASALSVPRHFMGKVLKKLAKEKILSSVKGPLGGFTINENTLNVRLLDIVRLTDGTITMGNCVLRFKECDGANPCPLHDRIEGVRKKLGTILSETTLVDLAREDKVEIIQALI